MKGDDRARGWEGGVVQQRPGIDILGVRSCRFTGSQVKGRLLGDLMQIFSEQGDCGPVGTPWCLAAGAQQGVSIYAGADLLDEQGEAGDGEMFPVPVWSRLLRLNDLSALLWWGQEAFLRVS